MNYGEIAQTFVKVRNKYPAHNMLGHKMGPIDNMSATLLHAISHVARVETLLVHSGSKVFTHKGASMSHSTMSQIVGNCGVLEQTVRVLMDILLQIKMPLDSTAAHLRVQRLPER